LTLGWGGGMIGGVGVVDIGVGVGDDCVDGCFVVVFVFAI